MSVFDNKIAPNNDMFIKHDSGMLKNIYGTEEIKPYWVADMDFAVAAPITEELKRLVERGVYSYEFNSQGVYSALVEWNKKRHNLSLKSDSFVQVSGVLTGVSLLIREFSEPGDGVLIQNPAYHQFPQMISSAGRKVVKNPLVVEDGKYKIDFDDFEQKLKTENVKIVLLCNPHNPTGRVWTREELSKLIEIAEKYQTLIISDEIHSDIILGDNSFNSLASFDYEKSIVLLGSPAKTFGMHSISNGYIYTENDALFQQIKGVVSSMHLGHGNALTTFATIAAYKHGEQWLDELLVYLENTVNWVKAFIREEMPSVKMFRPEGTYQIWFDFSELGLTDDDLKALVFQKAGMGLTPGAWFGATDGGQMRMNIASPLG